MDQVVTPFYADLKFWSLVISILALLLSQLQFFVNVFRRASITVEAYNQMFVFHRYGNPNIFLHLILLNAGGRKVRVKGIKINISTPSGATFSLPATSYLAKQGDTQHVLFTPFSLAPGEEWGHIINFYNLLSRHDEKIIREATAALRDDVVPKAKNLGSNPDGITIYAEERFMKPFRDFFARHSKWAAEEYDMTLSIDTEPPKAFKEQHYRFVLFESDIDVMRAALERYATGFGVYAPIDIPEGVAVPVQKRG